MNRNNPGKLSLWLTAVLVMLSCASPVLLTAPSPTPTLDTASMQAIIAQTAAAAQTGTKIALPPTATFTLTASPTRVPTETWTPSPTYIFVNTSPVMAINATASALYADDDEEYAEGDEEEPTPQPWSCKVISRLPDRGGTVKRGALFYAQWLVENTGTRTWPVEGVDVVFYTGGRFHDKPYYNLPATIPPGGRVTVIVPLTAPKRVDAFSTTWALQVGKRVFCALKISFYTQ